MKLITRKTESERSKGWNKVYYSYIRTYILQKTPNKGIRITHPLVTHIPSFLNIVYDGLTIMSRKSLTIMAPLKIMGDFYGTHVDRIIFKHDDLEINGTLTLFRCGIEKLPKNLKVDGDFFYEGKMSNILYNQIHLLKLNNEIKGELYISSKSS